MTAKQNRWMWVLIVLLTLTAAAVCFIPRLGQKYPTSYGLDIKGGVRLVLEADTAHFKGKWGPDKLEMVRNILEHRVNFTGVSEPTLLTKPETNQIIVELPGLKNLKEAEDRLSSTASLEFYLLPQLGKSGSPGPWQVESRDDPKTGVSTETIYDRATGKPVSPEELEATVFSREPIVTGANLLPESKANLHPTTNKPIIDFKFDPEGAGKFEEVTRANIGGYLAVFLDKRLLTAPTIEGVISTQGMIEGNFTLESAKSLADQLNAGALPVPLKIVEERSLEATLGADAVHTTTTAGIIGLSLVLVFMIIFYRLPGVLADIALVLYTLFSFAVFKGLLNPFVPPITLTLPGIAGFILSIGMAVDANILIFERLKEELRAGKTLRNAVDAGFKRAFTAIFDSNVCTILTCIILYNFGTGPIRGFALTLGVGVLISMFTAITVSRTFLFSLVGHPFAQNAAMYGLGNEFHRHLNVMKHKWVWLTLSGLIIIPGLVFWGMGGIKRSIDFKGGTELQVAFQQRHSADQIVRAIAPLGPKYRDVRVVVSESNVDNFAFITTERLDTAEREAVLSTVTQKVGALAPGKGVAFSNVSGSISKQLTWNAILAIVYASVLIILYLAFRFSIGGFGEGLKYGSCAVIALLHDVLVVWGSFAILGKLIGWQVDSLFVTAMLTVIGFSVHDTIIIFDRMRENLQNRIRGESFSDMADRSVDQTITRSINTSFTVVLTLTALFLFGGGIIHQFVGALLIGIISGTYSSIFNASVLLVMWKQKDLAPAPSRAPVGRAKGNGGDMPLVSVPAGIDAPQIETSDRSADAGDDSPRAVRRPPARRRRM